MCPICLLLVQMDFIPNCQSLKEHKRLSLPMSDFVRRILLLQDVADCGWATSALLCGKVMSQKC